MLLLLLKTPEEWLSLTDALILVLSLSIKSHSVAKFLSHLFAHPLVNVLTKFHGKPSNLHTLLIPLKRRNSLKKTSFVSFCFLKIYKHVTPSMLKLYFQQEP